MLYRFPELFYRSQPSPCAPSGDGQQLSDGDKRGLKLLYPKGTQQVDAIGERRERLLEVMEGPADRDADRGLEAAGPRLPEIARDAAARLRASLEQLRR